MKLDDAEAFMMSTMMLRTTKGVILLKKYMQEHQERVESHVCTCLLCIQTELLVNPVPRAVGGNTLSEEEWVRYHEGTDEDRKQIDDEVKRRLQEAMERRARWEQERVHGEPGQV